MVCKKKKGGGVLQQREELEGKSNKEKIERKI